MKHHEFIIADSIREIKDSGFDLSEAMQVYGKNDSIKEFANDLDLDIRWIPFGYKVCFIVQGECNSMTAFIFKHLNN